MKKNKKKFFIRWKGFLPLFIIISIIIIGYSFFFDNILKNILEKKASEYNGASVTIEELNSSIRKRQLTISKLQWANSKKLDYNLFEIGNFSIKVNWFPFLQKKIYFEEIKLTDFGINIKRDNAAERVIDSKKEGNKNSNFIDKSLEKGSDKLKNTTDFVGGKVNEQIEEVKKELNNESLDLQKEKSNIEKKYQNKLNEFSKNFQIEEDLKQLKSFDYQNIKTKQDLFKAKRQIDKLNLFNKKIKKAENNLVNLEKSFKKDSKILDNKKSIFSKIVAKNKKKILSQIKDFTSLDGSISRKIFGNFFIDKVAGLFNSYQKYSYLIPKKNQQKKQKIKLDEELAEKEKKRKQKLKQGRDIHFTRNFDPPSFFIKKIFFSSKENRNGILEGTVENLSSDVFYKDIKNNLKIKYNDFYFKIQGEIKGIKGKEKDKPDENRQVLVEQNVTSDSFPIAKYLTLEKNDYVEKITTGTANIVGKFKDFENYLTLKLLLTVKNVAFQVKPQNNKQYQKALNNLFSEINLLTIEIEVKKSKDKELNDVKITSNLDKVFKKKLSKYWQDVKKQQRRKVEALYQKEVNKLILDINKQISIDEIKGLKDSKNILQDSKNLVKKIQNKIDEVQSREKEKLQNKIKKEKEKILKDSQEKIKKGLKDLF